MIFVAGTAHPPGYPTYTFLTFVVSSFIKMCHLTDNVAYAMNLTSCAFGSLTSFFITKSIIDLMKMKQMTENEEVKVMTAFSALTMSLINAFSPLMWFYHTTSEVFALNNFFVSAIVYVCLKYTQVLKIRYMYIGAFLCGLSLTNQHTSILLVVPLILWVLLLTTLNSGKKSLNDRMVIARDVGSSAGTPSLSLHTRSPSTLSVFQPLRRGTRAHLGKRKGQCTASGHC